MKKSPSDDDTKANSSAGLTTRRGRIWRRTKFIAGSPIATFGRVEVQQGARFIGTLADLLRKGPPRDERLTSDEMNRLDRNATAFQYGIRVEELDRRIYQRRKQTARASYAFFGLGSLFFLLWMSSAILMHLSVGRVLSALEFLPFCVFFYLLAFKSAWMNWQLRTGRLEGAIAYLTTTDPFLPG